MKAATAWQIAGLVCAIGAVSFAGYFYGTGREAIAPIGVVALVMYLALTLVSRMPLQRINLPAPLPQEKLHRLEPLIRGHLASLNAFTVALFTWMEIAAGFGWMRIYLWTCWMFLAGIGVSAMLLIRRVGRESSSGEFDQPWNA